MDVYNCYLVEGGGAGDLKDLGYNDLQSVTNEIKQLFQAFSTDLLYGKMHYAPCSAWRSEQILLGRPEYPRFARRLHVFEKSDSQTLVASRYLGYVSLRPFEREPQNFLQYVTVAHITMPRYMLRPRYHIITCVGGPAENVLPFRCVPFCFPLNDRSLRASCLHATLYAGMLLKMNSYNYVPVSSQEMIFILWERKIRQDENSVQSDDNNAIQSPKEAASLQDALDVLRTPTTQAGGILETITLVNYLAVKPEDAKDYYALRQTRDEFDEAGWLNHEARCREIRERFLITYEDQVNRLKLEAHRCMTEYLANGMPLVLEVDLKEIQNGLPLAHSILVFGMHLLHDPEEVSYLRKLSCETRNRRRVDFVELPGRFVTHDIRKGPFFEYSAHNLLDKMWYEDDNNWLLSGISFLALAPENTRIGIGTVRAGAREKVSEKKRTDSGFWERYLEIFFHEDGEDTSSVESFDDLRYVTRLMKSAQIEKRYFFVKENEEWRDPEQLDRVRAAGDAWRRCVETYQEERWWVVEVRTPYYASAKDSQNEPMEAPPALVYFWSTQGISPLDNSPSDFPEPCAMITYIGTAAEYSRATVAFAFAAEEEDYKYELHTQRT